MSGATTSTAAERRTLTLGADAWAVLASAAAGLQLPSPLSPASSEALSAAQRASAEAALRGSGLVPGHSGELIADLHPAVQASLAVHAVGQVAVDCLVGLGHDLTATRAALAGELASSLSREQHATGMPSGDGAPATELGPVTWTTAPAEQLAALIAEQLGELPEHDGAPAQLDGATALAVVRALRGGRGAVADELAGGPPPQALIDAAEPLERAARIDVAGPGGRAVLLAVQAQGRWWQLGAIAYEVTLDPLSEASLITQLAGCIGDALLAGSRP